MMMRMVKVMMVNIRAATVNYDVNVERQELLNGKKKRDKDDQIIAADGAKTMVGTRAGGVRQEADLRN